MGAYLSKPWSYLTNWNKKEGPEFLSEPWRVLPKNKKEDLEFAKSYQPRIKGINHLRILLHGPVGAGKSSFINSVDSVLQDRISGRVPTDANSTTSFTLEYKTYRIYREDQKNTFPFVFNDVMGFEQEKGVLVEDIKLALMGHVRDGYKFSPEHQLKRNDEKYNPSPTMDDRVHVLVSVIPADTASSISEEVMKKMREIRLAAREMGIPHLAILTKVDKACAKVKEDINNVYWSKYLKKQVDEFHLWLGIPQDCIFLVKNYGSDGIMNDDINAPILSALRQMITYGEDYLRDLET